MRGILMKENEQKRNRILDAATEVFATVGYNGADVQEIADRADVGKGTVYRYFTNKENLFWECGIRVFQFLEGASDRAIHSKGNPLERLKQALTASSEFFTAHPNAVSIMMQVRFAQKRIPEKVDHYLQHTFFAPIQNLFQEAINEGLFPPGDPLDYKISMMDAFWGITVFHRVGDDTRTLTDRILFTFRLMNHGFLTEKGRKIVE